MATFALLSTAGSFTACSLLTSYDNFTGGAESASDASDASIRGDAGAGEAGIADVYQPPTTEETLCSPNIPANPGGNKPMNGNATVTFTGVVSGLRFTAAAGGCPLGKNLDGLDTCDAAAGDSGRAACVPADGTNPNCDEPGGIDIAGQMLLFDPTNLAESHVDLQDELPGDLAAQRSGFVLSVTGYGGELDNPQVTVDYLNDVSLADGGGTIVEDASIGQRYNQEDRQAYVSNGVLVANFARLPVHLTYFLTTAPSVQRSMIVTISSASILGHPMIDTDAGGLTMNDAQIVGRMTSDDLVALLANFYACFGYSAAPTICPDLDLPVTPSNDGAGLGCDAISIAIGFDLQPTTIAGYAAPVPAVDYCLELEGGAPFNGNLCGTSVDAGDDAGE